MKRKNEKSDNIWDKIINILWYLLFGFMFGMLVIISVSIKGHCSGIENSPYFPMEQNHNNLFTDNDKSFFETTFDSENNYIFVHYYRYTRFKNCHVFVFSKSDTGSICGEVNNNGYQFSLYKIGDVSSICYDYQYDSGNNTWFRTATITGNGLNQFVNVDSNLYTSTTDYISNFQLYTSNSDSKQVVLTYSSGFFHDYGHATPPDDFLSPEYPTGHTPPHQVPPTYTINNYSWTTYTPPTVDNSTLEKLLESLTDIVKYNANYLKDNLHNEIANLIDNIKGLIDYIGQTIQYYGDLIISNIQNLITTFYNNMVSLGEDIAGKVGYISEPFDSTELTTAFESMQIYDDYDRCGQLIDDAFGFFDDISEPQTFRIPIDLRGITLLHQTQILYLDLGWINSAKSVIRAFMWTITTFGLLYTVIDSIPDYIQGQDE